MEIGNKALKIIHHILIKIIQEIKKKKLALFYVKNFLSLDKDSCHPILLKIFFFDIRLIWDFYQYTGLSDPY